MEWCISETGNLVNYLSIVGVFVGMLVAVLGYLPYSENIAEWGKSRYIVITALALLVPGLLVKLYFLFLCPLYPTLPSLIMIVAALTGICLCLYTWWRYRRLW